MGKLNDKIVFITGGASGIGKASAIEAAKEGATVVVADLANAQHEATIQEIAAFDRKTLFVPIDVADANSVKQAIETTVKTFGRLDVGLNNAGIGFSSKNVAETSEEEYLRVININLNGVFYCMKYELQQFLQQGGGTVVNMASALGTVGQAGSAPYVAAKHGVLGLTKSAALEFGAHHIRVVALCPGYVETPMIGAADEQHRQELRNRHALKRLATSEEIAKAFIWLASDDASFVTGSAILVDGGYTAQ
jgi:NAD(P)-dependent dehydrogenase (short-subunit alcohol dehydrogenase family)